MVLVAGDVCPVPGCALVAHDQFWFFDHDDCLVADINDGTPYNFELARIEGCSVLKHESYALPRYRNVEVEPVSWPDPQFIHVILGADGEELALSVPAGMSRDAAGGQSHQSNFAKFLQLIDNAIRGQSGNWKAACDGFFILWRAAGYVVVHIARPE